MYIYNILYFFLYIFSIIFSNDNMIIMIIMIISHPNTHSQCVVILTVYSPLRGREQSASLGKKYTLSLCVFALTP